MQNSLPLAHGGNAVNTILVDFRGLDTLGEVAVIAVATLGIRALLAKEQDTIIVYNKPWILTPILQAIMPTILHVAFFFSIYLLVRGHDYPGGGFIGGMNLAISTVLGFMCLGKNPYEKWKKVNGLKLMMVGLLISLISGVIPLFVSEHFMTALFSEYLGIVSTPFLFDLGIFLLVLGAVVTILFVMRINTIDEERHDY